MPDVRFDSFGSIVSVTPMNKRARKWIDRNVHSEPWQWRGLSLVVDHRYADDLAAGMRDAGLNIDTGSIIDVDDLQDSRQPTPGAAGDSAAQAEIAGRPG